MSTAAAAPLTSSSGEITMLGSDTMSQALTGITLVFLLYISLSASEYIYTSFAQMWTNRIELFPDTYPSGSKMFTALQNPTNPMSKTIYTSKNQRTGIEFSYSMFLNISSDTFATGNTALYHIMHKGYSKMYPLMGPGIFCRGDRNTLRIYMNSFGSWNNYVEIDNIPIDKWFHLVISCKGSVQGNPQGSVLYIYINGNIKQKLKLSGNTPPYQNYGNVYLFSSRTFALNKSNVISLNNDPEFIADQTMTDVQFLGAAKGSISRVYYYSYALSYTELKKLMDMGPSPNVSKTNENTISPYLAQTWWTNDGTRYD
jgi:hypothetical protein